MRPGAFLTLRDDVVALILGFEGEPEDFPLQDTSLPRMVAALACRFAVRPWRWRDAGFLRRSQTDFLRRCTSRSSFATGSCTIGRWSSAA